MVKNARPRSATTVESGSGASRTILPFPDQTYSGMVLYDAKDPDAKYQPIRPLRPPAGAPNVLIADALQGSEP